MTRNIVFYIALLVYQWDKRLFSAALLTTSLRAHHYPTQQNNCFLLEVLCCLLWFGCTLLELFGKYLKIGFSTISNQNRSPLLLNSGKWHVLAWLIDCESLKMTVSLNWSRDFKRRFWNEMNYHRESVCQLSGMFCMPNIKYCNISITFQSCMIVQNLLGAKAFYLPAQNFISLEK